MTVKSRFPNATIYARGSTHENDPFFLRKAEQARKKIERCGIPQEILEIRESIQKKIEEDKLKTKWHHKLKAGINGFIKTLQSPE